MSEWINMEDDEVRKTIRLQGRTVMLRVLLGGNGLRTPIAEIISDYPIIKLNSKGNPKPPTRWVDGCLLPQRKTIKDAKHDVEFWFERWSKSNPGRTE